MCENHDGLSHRSVSEQRRLHSPSVDEQDTELEPSLEQDEEERPQEMEEDYDGNVTPSKKKEIMVVKSFKFGLFPMCYSGRLRLILQGHNATVTLVDLTFTNSSPFTPLHPGLHRTAHESLYSFNPFSLRSEVQTQPSVANVLFFFFNSLLAIRRRLDHQLAVNRRYLVSGDLVSECL